MLKPWLFPMDFFRRPLVQDVGLQGSAVTFNVAVAPCEQRPGVKPLDSNDDPLVVTKIAIENGHL